MFDLIISIILTLEFSSFVFLELDVVEKDLRSPLFILSKRKIDSHKVFHLA